MKIQDMPAGPEMDRLVAEKVMGWRLISDQYEATRIGGVIYPCWVDSADQVRWSYLRQARHGDNQAPFSRDISHAWEVVERVTDIKLQRRADGFPPSTVFMHHFQKSHLWAMSAKDAAAEICRAALIAVGCEVVP